VKNNFAEHLIRYMKFAVICFAFALLIIYGREYYIIYKYEKRYNKAMKCLDTVPEMTRSYRPTAEQDSL